MPELDRRQHPRFMVSPMYTEAQLRVLDEDTYRHVGHVYDMSEGGVQFEMDRPIAPGTAVALQVALPNPPANVEDVDGYGRAIFVVGNVVWCESDEPGPARMAMVITRYCHAGDRERLLRRLTRGQYLRAA